MSIYDNYTKEYCYYLGYLWSDGYISQYKIELEIVREDGDNIFELLQSINNIKFIIKTRHRENRKEQMSLNVYNKEFSNYLSLLDYNKKSYSNFNKIINKISTQSINLIRYFILGLIDGDGCFYLSKDKRTRQFYITSSYEQDWSSIEDIFKYLNINRYKINKIIDNKGNKSSHIRITNYSDIVILYHYLYPNGYEIGLKRKHEKCLDIINSNPKFTSIKVNINTNDIKEKLNTLSIKEIAKIYNCSEGYIYKNIRKYNLRGTTL